MLGTAGGCHHTNYSGHSIRYKIEQNRKALKIYIYRQQVWVAGGCL